MASIQAGPHFEVASAEFAKWLEEQAPESWWNVDGDPLLMGRLSIPCPSDELAAELRTINRHLLVEATGDSDARGQAVDAGKVGALARFEGDLRRAGPLPPWVNERFFRLCWKGSDQEWFLIEDHATAQQFDEDAAKSR